MNRLRCLVVTMVALVLIGLLVLHGLAPSVTVASQGYLGVSVSFGEGFYDSEPQVGEDGYDIPVNSFYNRDSAHWLELDNEFTPAVAPWDWEVLEADYLLRVKEDFTAGQIIELALNASAIQFQPMALEWSNALAQIQPIAMPHNVVPVVTNPEVSMLDSVKHQGTIAWNDAYGTNIDFEWKSTPAILKKTLAISSLSDLPVPEQHIIDGGDAFLRLNLIFDPSTDLDIYVDNVLWGKKTEVQTFENIEFRKEGELLWTFMPLMYWDSADNEGQSVATLDRSGNTLYISVRVPYSWLQTAVYPVYVDADVQIDTALQGNFYSLGTRSGPFWRTPLIGYAIFVDSGADVCYRKTIDGGANWAAKVEILTGYVLSLDCWADWQTEGDDGTLIHMACIDTASDDILYVYLDTSDDSTGSDKIADCLGTGAIDIATPSKQVHAISITKARGGNLGVAFHYKDDADEYFYKFYTSPDGDAWTSKSNPLETREDHILLFPGNEADNQDLWGAYWDASANTISLKTFDNSGNSWAEQTIGTSMYEESLYLQMDGVIRLSDGHLILAAWNDFNSATADLKVWDINGSGSITAKTNVITNTAEYALVSVFVNQGDDDIYVAYVGGTDMTTKVKVFYQKSDDGGGTWSGSDQTMQANDEDDERWISCGAVKEAWGGKFQPIWFNDDMNDLFTNTDNGITIDAPCSPNIEISGSTWNVDGGSPVSVDTSYSTGLTWCTITNNSGGAISITIGGTDMIGGGYTWDLSDDGSNGDMIYGMHAGLEGSLPIDIGASGVVRDSSVGSTVTRISLVNPANDAGIITTVELYVAMDMTELRVGTFYLVSGTTYKCRDSVALGNPPYTGETTYFNDLSIDVEVGDFIGCYYASGQLENTDFGGEDKFIGGEHIDPGDEASYTLGATKILSLGGIGEGVSYTIIVKESAPYNTLKSGLADSGTQKFGLQLETPTVFDDGNEKSGTVTLTATCD